MAIALCPTKEAAISKHPDVNRFERMVGLKMVKIKESMATEEPFILALNNKKLAYVMSELRIKMIAMKICRTHPKTRLYIGNQKIHAKPRAMALSRQMDPKLKTLIDREIKRVQSYGLFDLWISRAMNRSRLRCVRTEDFLMRAENNNEIMFTLNLLSKLFRVITGLSCVCIVVVVIEANSSTNRRFKSKRLRNQMKWLTRKLLLIGIQLIECKR